VVILAQWPSITSLRTPSTASAVVATRAKRTNQNTKSTMKSSNQILQGNQPIRIYNETKIQLLQWKQPIKIYIESNQSESTMKTTNQHLQFCLKCECVIALFYWQYLSLLAKNKMWAIKIFAVIIWYMWAYLCEKSGNIVRFNWVGFVISHRLPWS